MNASDKSHKAMYRGRPRKLQAEPPLTVRRLPDRVSTVELAERQVPSKLPGQAPVRADDLIIDGIIDRALNKASYRDMVDLYKLLDAEEDADLAHPRVVITPYRMKKYRGAMRNHVRNIRRMSVKICELGLATLDPRGTLHIPPAVQYRIRHRGVGG